MRVLLAIAVASLGVGVVFAIVDDYAGLAAAAVAGVALAPPFAWVITRAAKVR